MWWEYITLNTWNLDSQWQTVMLSQKHSVLNVVKSCHSPILSPFCHVMVFLIIYLGRWSLEMFKQSEVDLVLLKAGNPCYTIHCCPTRVYYISLYTVLGSTHISNIPFNFLHQSFTLSYIMSCFIWSHSEIFVMEGRSRYILSHLWRTTKSRLRSRQQSYKAYI